METRDTFDQIQRLSSERLELMRLAGKQHLTQAQLEHWHEIEGRLPGLWDLHRRELVAGHRPEKNTSYALLQAA
jgi:hypothetical protein